MATNPPNKLPSSRPKAEGATKTEQLDMETEASPLSIEGLRSGVINHILLKVVMFLLIAIFAVGFLFTSFNPTRGLNPDGTSAPTGSGPATVARVGDTEIERARFEQMAMRQDEFMSQFGQKVGPLEYFGSRSNTLTGLISNAAQVQAGRAAGLTVSEDEIKAEINKQIDEAIKSQKSQGEAAFRRQVEARYGSVEKYRAELQTLVEADRANIESSLVLKKLEAKIKEENKVTEDDYKKSVTKLKLRVLVVRPKIAPAGDKALTDKNKAEAKTNADKIAAQIKKAPTPQNFAAIAKKESADFATKDKGGDLGWKLPAELQVSPAAKAAILKSSDKVIGPVVDEATGDISIFMVEGRALKLPADFGKNKVKLIKDFETAQDNEAWQKYQADIGKAAQSEIVDPGLQAYKIQTEQIFTAPADQQNQLRQDAVVKYEEALKYAIGMEAAAVRYQLAQLYRDLKQPKKAVEVLKTASEQTNNAPALDFEYARALREAGDKKTAIAELEKVSKEMDTAPPAAPSMFGGNPNDALRYQISAEFDTLGRKDLAAAERKKVAPPQNGGMPGGMMMPGGGAMGAPGGVDPHAGHGH